MFKFFETSSSPLVSVMVAGAGRENLIVSPLRAFFRAVRSEPGPVSAVLVTVRVAAPAVCAASSATRRSAWWSFMGFPFMDWFCVDS